MSNEEVNEVEKTEAEEADEEDSTDWKAEAERAKAEAEKYKAMAKRYKKSSKSEPEEETKKSKEITFDYGQKAYLVANGIKGKDEVELVREYVERTGKEIEDVLESKHFKQELKDLRDEATAKEAMPSSSKRSGNTGRDSVEYWLAKGEMPPAGQTELRRQYVNAKIKTQTSGRMFYNS